MYIAVHLDAERKRKALKVSLDLGWSPSRVIDHIMVPVWKYAADQEGDGGLGEFDEEIFQFITHGICPEGALKSIIDRGWLVMEGGMLYCNDWKEHQPFFARRARDRKKKKNGDGASTDCDGTSAAVDESPLRGEERRREERGGEPPPPSTCFSDQVESEFTIFLGGLSTGAKRLVKKAPNAYKQMIADWTDDGKASKQGVIGRRMARIGMESAKSAQGKHQRFAGSRFVEAIKAMDFD